MTASNETRLRAQNQYCGLRCNECEPGTRPRINQCGPGQVLHVWSGGSRRMNQWLKERLLKSYSPSSSSRIGGYGGLGSLRNTSDEKHSGCRKGHTTSSYQVMTQVS